MKNLLLLFLLFLPFGHVTAEIHKCVAEDGSLRFSDVPCGEQATAYKQQRMRTTPNDAQRNLKRDKLLRAYEHERREKQQAEKQARQDKLARTRNCAQARDYLGQIKGASGVYDLDEQGKRVFRDPGGRSQAIADAQADVNFWCK